MKELAEILLKIRLFEFEAETGMLQSGWSGYGKGIVKSEKRDEKIIIFYEEGTFYQKNGKQFKCKNIYRWSFENNLLNMEHLRFGEANPVHLFYLRAEGEKKFISACPHLCDKDAYTADMEISDERMKLSWQVNGPEKAEKINYYYS